MNDFVKYAWYFFLAFLTFGIWTIPMVIAAAAVCYIYYWWKYEHSHKEF